MVFTVVLLLVEYHRKYHGVKEIVVGHAEAMAASPIHLKREMRIRGGSGALSE
jgi:hypothetical protein